MKYILSILFVIIVFIGCTPEPIKIDVPQLAPKLVVSSQIVPTQIMVVSVTKSFGALDYKEPGEDEENETDTLDQDLLDKIIVKHAQVTIDYMGITDTLFELGNGFYASISTPQYLNVDYTLRVSDPETGMSVLSSAKMLELVKFDTVYGKRDFSSSIDAIDITYKINDPSGQNWYVVNFYDPTDTSGFSSFGLSVGKTELLLVNDVEDDLQAEQTYRLRDWEQDTIAVSVSNISKGYYDYLTARKRSGGIGAVLGEPVNFPTNIEGGYGYFTTHFPDVHIVEVQ